MQIKRMNADFGNSMYMSLIEGVYYEFSTNVVEVADETEISRKLSVKAESAKELYDRMAISFPKDNGERAYYLVGNVAEKELKGNSHIDRLHNKVTSPIPMAVFLSSLALHHELMVEKGEMKEEKTDDGKSVIKIDYFQTMLPLWLLIKEAKFSEQQKAMADRYTGTHEFKLETLGMEKEFVVEIEDSDCRIEGEVARWHLKRDFHLAEKPEAAEFSRKKVVVVDIGGGTVDIAILGEGLKSPQKREHFLYSKELPYLAEINRLYNEKLPEYFDDVRQLEDFIVRNAGKSKMVLRNPITQEQQDLTQPVSETLKKYSSDLMYTVEQKVQDVVKNDPPVFLYIGGVANIIFPFIYEIASAKYGEENADKYHKTLPEDARKANLYGLEVLSLYMQSKKESTAASAEPASV